MSGIADTVWLYGQGNRICCFSIQCKFRNKAAAKGLGFPKPNNGSLCGICTVSAHKVWQVMWMAFFPGS